MLLSKRLQFISRPDMTLTAANFPAQTVKIPIDRTWPIEEIVIVVHATLNGAITNWATGTGAYGLLGILKRANLYINDGVQPRNIIDVTGPGLLIDSSQKGLSLDRSTQEIIVQMNRNSTIAAAVARIAYRIPIVHPKITDSLRTRMMLPAHIHVSDPVLTCDFAAAAELSATANPFTAVSFEVILVRRAMGPEQTKALLDSGGFIPFDYSESQFALANGLTNVEQRFLVNTPGNYTGLTVHSASGATQADLSASVAVGSETKWRLESGGVAFLEWRAKHMQILNDLSRPKQTNVSYDWNAAAYAANDVAANDFGGALAAGLIVQAPSSYHLDFLTDGETEVNELGSLLDANIPANNGLKLEIVGAVTTTAASTFNVVGHRLFGNLSKWQAFKAA